MIVLVTDGIEECGGDPCAAARAIKASGVDLKAHIIGFTLNDKQRAAIECVAKETGGQYFEAKNTNSLRDALQSVQRIIAEPGLPTPPPPAPPPERFNLLAQKNGGELIFSTGQDWPWLTDEKLQYVWRFGTGAEGVFGFRDGRVATFDALAVYIPGAEARHPKEIELFAGDEGPTGAFQSLGVITVANGKLRDGWQEFKLPRTTARFLKVKLLSNHGGNGFYLYELRLFGELAAASGPSPGEAAAAGGGDILSPQQGGEMLLGTANWKRVNDGGFAYVYGFGIGAEGVFGFRGGRPARFDGFGVYVPVHGIPRRSSCLPATRVRPACSSRWV